MTDAQQLAARTAADPHAYLGAHPDGDGGVVVPPGDLPALAAALEQFLGDPTAAREAGERARAAALAHHTPEAAVPDVRALHARLTGGAAA